MEQARDPHTWGLGTSHSLTVDGAAGAAHEVRFGGWVSGGGLTLARSRRRGRLAGAAPRIVASSGGPPAPHRAVPHQVPQLCTQWSPIRPPPCVPRCSANLAGPSPPVCSARAPWPLTRDADSPQCPSFFTGGVPLISALVFVGRAHTSHRVGVWSVCVDELKLVLHVQKHSQELRRSQRGLGQPRGKPACHRAGVFTTSPLTVFQWWLLTGSGKWFFCVHISVFSLMTWGPTDGGEDNLKRKGYYW